ncbi:MAG: hypothetical protein ACKVVP_20385 [Chloroflexota bacterium]
MNSVIVRRSTTLNTSLARRPRQGTRPLTRVWLWSLYWVNLVSSALTLSRALESARPAGRPKMAAAWIQWLEHQAPR